MARGRIPDRVVNHDPATGEVTWWEVRPLTEEELAVQEAAIVAFEEGQEDRWTFEDERDV